jgi:hypothetical protein
LYIARDSARSVAHPSTGNRGSADQKPATPASHRLLRCQQDEPCTGRVQIRSARAGSCSPCVLRRCSMANWCSRTRSPVCAHPNSRDSRSVPLSEGASWLVPAKYVHVWSRRLHNDWRSAARPRRSAATEGLVSCNGLVRPHSALLQAGRLALPLVRASSTCADSSSMIPTLAWARTNLPSVLGRGQVDSGRACAVRPSRSSSGAPGVSGVEPSGVATLLGRPRPTPGRHRDRCLGRSQQRQPCGNVQVAIRAASRPPLGRPGRPPERVTTLQARSGCDPGSVTTAALGAANKAAPQERPGRDPG